MQSGKKSNDYYFEILGVTRKSTKGTIKQAFRDLIKKWHPDKFPNDNDARLEATEKSKLIIEAYEVLENYEQQKLENEDVHSSIYTTKRKGPNEGQEILRTIVKSSNIHSVGYDGEKKILQIVFLNGGFYEYYNVPEIVFKEFMNASSKGKYANRNIFFSYRYARVT